MRDIQFRAWDGLRITTCGISYNNSTGQLVVPKGMVLMEFTGLKDKNNVEIYEGDILLKIYNENSHQNKVANMFVCKWHEQNCSFGLSVGKCHSYEVIGNIYQNSELLLK